MNPITPLEKKRKVFVRLHLGLGDAVVCNGLIRELAKTHSEVIIPCWPHNKASVTRMFRDISTQIKILPVNSDKGADAMQENHRPSMDIITLGFGGKDFDHKKWDECFYKQAGLPFATRWTSFLLQRDDHRELRRTTSKPFIFVHDDSSRGFKINLGTPEAEVVRPHKLDHIFHWCWLIENAAEVHMIDGPFLALADSLNPKGKLFLHKNVRDSIPPALKLKWVIPGGVVAGQKNPEMGMVGKKASVEQSKKGMEKLASK